MKILVTGGSGFVGSNLVDALLAAEHTVTAYDNLSTGTERFLCDASSDKRFEFIDGDVLDLAKLTSVVSGHDVVVHLSANADVRYGWNSPTRDLAQNTVGTQNVLEAMRSTGVRRILFASTGSVYGEAAVFPTVEEAPFPTQTSLYGASKLAAEGLITAYCEAGFASASIFRFVSILGPRYTHGHVYDFVRQLTKNPNYLRVLGDGSQRKSYLHVSDCIAAILLRLDAEPKSEVLNLGFDGYCEVKDSIRWITRQMGLTPEIHYSGGSRGWVGDNPFIYLAIDRMRSLGWEPKVPIGDAVTDTVKWLLENQWVFEANSESNW